MIGVVGFHFHRQQVLPRLQVPGEVQAPGLPSTGDRHHLPVDPHLSRRIDGFNFEGGPLEGLQFYLVSQVKVLSRFTYAPAHGGEGDAPPVAVVVTRRLPPGDARSRLEVLVQDDRGADGLPRRVGCRIVIEQEDVINFNIPFRGQVKPVSELHVTMGEWHEVRHPFPVDIEVQRLFREIPLHHQMDRPRAGLALVNFHGRSLPLAGDRYR